MKTAMRPLRGASSPSRASLSATCSRRPTTSVRPCLNSRYVPQPSGTPRAIMITIKIPITTANDDNNDNATCNDSYNVNTSYNDNYNNTDNGQL